MNHEPIRQPSEPETLGLRPPRSSRHRYLKFVADYKQRRLDALIEGTDEETRPSEEPKPEEGPEKKRSSWQEALGFKRGKRREYLREYLIWLWPHGYAVAVLAVLAFLVAAMEMAEPLFMRFIIDRVLLNTGLESATRLAWLQLVGVSFLAVIVVSHAIGVLKDYRQRLLNIRVMLS